MWSGPIARITKNSTNWPTANQAWRRLTSSCESGKILTTVCALTKPWDILLPRNSCSSGNANLKRQSVTNLLDEYTHALLTGGGRRGSASSREEFVWRACRQCESAFARPKIFCAGCIFFLHAVATLVFCECELALPQRRERFSLRRTRVKIEFYIASCPATFPRDPNSKEKSRQTYALAACGRHLLHGVWRHVRDGRDHSRRGLRPWDFDFAVPAGAMVPTDSVHDRRALQRAATGGWLLRVGAARFG